MKIIKSVVVVFVLALLGAFTLDLIKMAKEEDDRLVASESRQLPTMSSDPITINVFSIEMPYDEALSKAEEMCSGSSFRSYDDNFICELKPYDEFRVMRVWGRAYSENRITKMEFTSHMLNSSEMDSEEWNRLVTEKLDIKELKPRFGGGHYGFTESNEKVRIGDSNGLMLFPGGPNEPLDLGR